MPRLPDIPLQSWLADQQERFKEATAGLFPALDFELGARATESQIPQDYDAPGGRDQWLEVEQKNLEDQYRLQHEAEERRRQEEIDQQAAQYAAQQQSEEAQQQQVTQQRESSVMDMIRSLGIPTPSEAFASLTGTGAGSATGDHTSTTGVFDQRTGQMAPPVASPPPSEVDQFNSMASGMMTDAFGAPTPDPTQPQPDNTSTTGLLDRLGATLREAGTAAVQSVQKDTAIPSSAWEYAQLPSRLIPGLHEIQTLENAAGAAGDVIGRRTTEALGGGTEPLKGSEIPILDYPGFSAQDVGGLAGQLILDPANLVGAGAAPKAARAIEAEARAAAPIVRRGLETAGREVAGQLLDLGVAPRVIQGEGGLFAGAGSGRGAAEAIDTIKALLGHGLEDSAVAAERELAQKSGMTFAEIQEKTRGRAPAAEALPGEVENPWPLTPEERALNAEADARAASQPAHGGYLEDPSFGAEPQAPSTTLPVSPRDRVTAADLTPEERQLLEQYGNSEVPEVPPLITPENTRITSAERDMLSEYRTPSERVLEAGRPPNLTENRGLTPDEAIQQSLPGFEHLVPESRAAEGTGIRGFGTLPESLTPGPSGGMTRGQEQTLRETVGTIFQDQKPFTFAEREKMAADLLDETPEVVGPVLRRALGTDPRMAGAEQELLKQNVRSWGDALDQGRQELARVWDEVEKFTNENGSDKLPEDLAQELTYRATEFTRLTNEFSMAVKGQGLSAKAASQIMNAQRGGRLGAYAVAEANRVNSLGEAAGKAARGAQRARTGIVDKETEDALRETAAKLGSERTRRATSGRSKAGEELENAAPTPRTGRGGGTGKGRGGGRPPAAAKTPEGETLAETLGRLKREQGRMELSDSGATNADLTRVRSEISDILQRVKQEAQEVAEQRVKAKASRAPLTPEEEDAVIHEAIGRRTISGIRRRAMDDASGATDRRMAGQIQVGIDKALTKYYNDAKRLEAQIARQQQRRVDGILAQEKRAEARGEIKALSVQAQTWAKRIRDMPDQPGLRDEYNAILMKLQDHSPTGHKVANDLAERLDVNLSEDTFKKMSSNERRAGQLVTEQRMREIQGQINDVLKLPKGPDRARRIAGLYTDLSDVSVQGYQKASQMRQRANEAGILKSGLFAADADTAPLIEMVRSINPKDPSSLKPLLEVMARPSLWQTWREISFINMLSNPLTHLQNVSSTTLNGIGKVLIRNGLEQALSGGELSGFGAGLEGVGRGLKEGAGPAWQTWTTGVNPKKAEGALASGDIRPLGREVLPQALASVGEQLDRVLPGSVMQKSFGRLGEAMHRISTRPLESMDALMGQMMYASETARLAQQKADSLIKSGAYVDHMKEAGSKIPLREQLQKNILANIWDHPEIIKQAGKVEDFTLFRSRAETGPLKSQSQWGKKSEQAIRMLMSIKEVGPNAHWQDKVAAGIVDFLMPFYNVPYNFTKQGVSSMLAPLGAPAGLVKLARGDKAGGAETLAKAIQGGAMLAVPSYLVMGDNLTFTGPPDEGDRRIWLEDHKPMSWRAYKGAPWISYEGTPYAIPFATVAGGAEAVRYAKPEETQSAAGAALTRARGLGSGAARGAMSQAFLEGAVRNFEAITGQNVSETAAATNAAGTITRYSPTGVLAPSGMLNFLANVFDSVERDAGKISGPEDIPQGISDRVQQRIPGLRNELPVKRGAFGEEIPREIPILGYRGRGPNEGDPITEQLQRGSIGLPSVPDELSVSKGKVPLTIREQQRFQQLYGEEYRSLLESIGAGQQMYTDVGLEKVRSKAREIAQKKVLGEMGLEEVQRRYRRDLPVEVAP